MEDEGSLLSIDSTCPSCGARMRVLTLPSETSVLRCDDCGQVVI